MTAQLPAFAQPGQSLNVTVASLANAKSLKGRHADRHRPQGRGWTDLRAGPEQRDGGRRRGASSGSSRCRSITSARDASRKRDGRAFGAHEPAAKARASSWTWPPTTSAPRARSCGPSTAPWEGTAQALDGRTVAVRAPEQPPTGWASGRPGEPRHRAGPGRGQDHHQPRTGSVVMNQAVTTIGAVAR